MGVYKNSKRGTETLDAVHGTLPAGTRFAGKRVEMTLTGTKADDVRWVAVAIQGERPRSYQFSGKNLPAAKAQLDEMRDALRAAGTLESA